MCLCQRREVGRAVLCCGVTARLIKFPPRQEFHRREENSRKSRVVIMASKKSKSLSYLCNIVYARICTQAWLLSAKEKKLSIGKAFKNPLQEKKCRV